MRSFERQQNGLIPTVHMGPGASALEAKSVRTMLGDLNRKIKQRNKLIISVRNGIKKLYAWLSDWTVQRKETSAQKPPTLHELLCDYLDKRIDERADWNGLARIKGLSKDLIALQELSDWLRKNNISEVSDLMNRLNSLEAKSKEVNAVLRKNNERRKQIGKIVEAASTIVRLKPIHDKYSKLFFQSAKAKYYAEHEEELKASKRAYAFLMREHEGKLEILPHEFDAELVQMNTADANAQTQLEGMKEELITLRKVKNFVSKVDPELLGQRLTYQEQLARAQAFVRQREAEERKEKQSTKEEQYR